MGYGVRYTCPKCGFGFASSIGIGFLFPTVYQETLAKAKGGELGPEIKEFFEEHPDGAINAESVTLCCDECGNLVNGKDLGMYVPTKEMPVSNENSCWSVAAPQRGISCVAKWDLDEYYEKYADYPHICEKCKGHMHIVKESETLICPKCKVHLEEIDAIKWD